MYISISLHVTLWRQKLCKPTTDSTSDVLAPRMWLRCDNELAHKVQNV